MADDAPPLPDALIPRGGRPRPPVALVVGPGRSGKSAVLTKLEGLWTAAGATVTSVAGRRLEQSEDGAVLDLLLPDLTGSAPSLARALAAALEPAPWLLLVDAGQWLDPLSARVVAALAERAPSLGGGIVLARRPCRLGVEQAALDGVLTRAQPVVALEPPADAPVDADAVRVELDQLGPGVRQAAVVMALGLPAPDGAAVDDLVAAGLAVPDGTLPAAVAAAVRSLAGATERVAAHTDAAHVLTAAGAPAVRIAPHLEAAGAVGAEAVTTLVDAARAIRETDSRAAAVWLDAAVDAGAEAASIAGLRAEVATRNGDVLAAARWADLAPGDADAGAATATVLAAAGLPRQWAEWARGLERWDEAAVAHLFNGDRDAAEDAYARATTALGAAPPLHAEMSHRTAAGALAVTGPDPAEGLAELEVAAALLEQLGGGPLSGETPHALAATVALQLVDVDRARRLVERGLAAGAGGPLHEHRLRLLGALVEVTAGRVAAARHALDGIGGLAQPRDRALGAAVAAAIARRGTDANGLLAAATTAVDALAAVGPDHLGVAVGGEIAVAVARMPGRGIVPPVPLTTAPGPLQALHLGWWRLQHALAAGDAAGVVAMADGLAAGPVPHPRLVVLVDAAAAWAGVVAGTADADDVIGVAHGLAAVGLGWDGASLAGAAALRAGDAERARALLACGRELAAADGPVDDDAAVGDLSEREQAVAALVVEGLTHKEIGARLYISAKTVEHHVARIRQKLGATSRAEMLAALRRET